MPTPPDSLPPIEEPSVLRALDGLGTRPALLWLMALALLALVGLADYVTGDEILLFLYIVPVGLLAWGAGLYAGLAGAVVSTGITLIVYVPLSHGSLLSLHAWHAAANLVSTSALAWAIAKLRADHVRILGHLERERRLSRQDPLTGLASAHAFQERLVQEIERTRRVTSPLSVLFLDLDDFKRINDERGHPAGNQLLARVGRLLQTTMRKVDLCGRLGGDEFAVLMPDTSAADALAAAQRVHEAMLRSFREGGAAVGMSAGLATFESPPLDEQMVMSTVDQLMYEAKHTGKNRIVTRVLP